jgi:dipeptidyl aminopeptidase/acylaminoacyl peptidase
MKQALALSLLLAASVMRAHSADTFDAAKAFGARPSVAYMSLSPDGNSVAYVVPIRGQGSAVITVGLDKGSQPRTALVADAKQQRLTFCRWVSNDRLVCNIRGIYNHAERGPKTMSRLVAVDADGKNFRILSTRQIAYSDWILLDGGAIIDWLPDESGSVLMQSYYLPETNAGHYASPSTGWGVDKIDTRSLTTTRVEAPNSQASRYITDGRGTIRIAGFPKDLHGQQTGLVDYDYRALGSREWVRLSQYNSQTREGFQPVAVDPEQNVAYGFKKNDGRTAIYTISLDGNANEQLVLSNPEVDITSLIWIGRRHQIVGATYVTETRHVAFFSPDVTPVIDSLSKALPGSRLEVTDSTVDHSKMLILSGSDSDPGLYYIFDRPARKLHTFLVVREQLEGVKLAKQRPITYPAEDGAMVPAYLTLPPGREDAKGLPTIVMPHGGLRDNSGFDWLAQFFANRGFAVIRPDFRGAGYGDAWFQQNGFRSWHTAISDLLAAGHWMVSQGIADAAKLAVVGWSYGGYAALQSATVEPETFKAVIAIAPVTDLAAYREDHRLDSNYELVNQLVGDGPQLDEASPVEHAASIKAPVLLFHGTADSSVRISQSLRMADKLKAVGARCELVTWDDLDHDLDDSSARAEMLSKSDAFLRQAFGM